MIEEPDVGRSPKCERMKSRNESFEEGVGEAGSDNRSATIGRRDSATSDDDDDDAFVNYDSSAEDDCLHFFDQRAQFASSQYQHNHSRIPNNSSSDSPRTKAEEELQEAVAYSGSLVGENILDEPPSDDGESSPTGALTASSIPCFRDIAGSSSSHTSSKNTSTAGAHGSRSTPSGNEPADAGLSAGLVAQGFAWVKSQREQRRRRYLQYQAEQQLRKIRAAQNAEKQSKDATADSKGLFSNPIFQNIASTVVGNSSSCDTAGAPADTDGLRRASSSRSDGSKNLDDSDGSSDGGIPAQATVSQSGAGYSVEIDLSFPEEEEDAAWIPPVRIEEEELSEEGSALCLLNEEQRQQVAQYVLPSGIAYAKWKRVYSLARDGDSFDTCLRLVKDYNQTLLIVRTSKNEIFGGFADASWEPPHLAGAQFYGGPGSCLFKVIDSPKAKIKAFKWTGANRYIQLTDSHRKLMAFGGGGDEGSFGLCVESDFQRGSTGPCDTFGNEPLCSEENFWIVDVEIFGFLLGQF